MAEVGKKVIGEVFGLKGHCNMGHKVGDRFELSAYNNGGLCGFFYYALYPYIMMLQFGGKWPDSWGGEVLEFDCPDRYNLLSVRIHPE